MGNIVCPDEKGTEIDEHNEPEYDCTEETLCAPMRRGLKLATLETLKPGILGNIVCPDEKGTEIPNLSGVK